MSRDEMNEWIFPIKERFKLSEKFLEEYNNKEPNWGPLGKLTYKRTYAARVEGEDRTEEWFETVKRVVETCYTIQLNHCKNLRLPWHAHKAQKSAQEMYTRMFSFKFIPPGRGLANMGDVVFKRGSMGLFNCSAVSTNSTNFSDPYVFMMDVSMCGVGVGFDTEGAGKFRFVKPKTTDKPFIVEDSREGWCEILRVVLESFVGKEHLPITIDYSQIRPAGSPIVTSGGIAPGPQPLIDCITKIQALMTKRIDCDITSSDIVDLMNVVGVCVVAGGKRRCLPEYTEIHTKDGLILIKDVKVGQEVLTMTGWKKVVDHVYQGKQSIVNIKTQLGDFKCTPQHRMKFFTSPNSFEFRKAEDVKAGDKMVFFYDENHEMGTNNLKLPEWSYEKPLHSTTCKDIIIPELNTDMAWFLGLLHGDGSVSSNQVSIVYHKDQEDIRDKAKLIMESFGVHVSAKLRSEEQCGNVYTKSRQLFLYLSQFKQSHKSIDIPDFIKTGDLQLKSSYIAGLFDADGTEGKPVSITSIYKDYLIQIQNLLASIGIASRVRLSRASINNWKDLYTINIVGKKHLNLFYKFVGNYSFKLQKTFDVNINRSMNDYGYPSEWIINEKLNYKRKWSPQSKQMTENLYNEFIGFERAFTPIEVLEVEYLNVEEETYDISVEDNHEFVCGPGLVSHNTAQIAFGHYNDKEYISLKDPDLYSEELMSHRWASNNSIYAEDGMDYTDIINTIKKSGEPGILYKHRMQNYGRIKDGYQEGIDGKATLLNPCGEISLESEELCNISDVFPARHDSLEDFKRSIKYAFLYCKTVTLVPTHLPTTNSKILKNRRIGISQSGIVQAIQKHGATEYFRWCDEGYNYLKNLDKKYSDWLCIQKSIKLTTVKPAGSTSLLMGSTPGIHFEHSEYYIRRIRVEETNVQLVQAVKDAGYKWEVSAYGDRSIVFEVPVKAENFYKGKSDVSVWEQMQLGSKIQSIWADNSVSQTVTFTKDESEYLKNVIEMYEDQFKTVSFLPLSDHGYVQAPYETITVEQYEEMNKKIKPINFNFKNTQDIIEKFCDGDKCTI